MIHRCRDYQKFVPVKSGTAMYGSFHGYRLKASAISLLTTNYKYLVV